MCTYHSQNNEVSRCENNFLMRFSLLFENYAFYHKNDKNNKVLAWNGTFNSITSSCNYYHRIRFSLSFNNLDDE